MFGVFVSTGVQDGGQELTAFQSLSVAIHHGMVFVPIVTKLRSRQTSMKSTGVLPRVVILFIYQLLLITLGAGTYSDVDGARMPSAL